MTDDRAPDEDWIEAANCLATVAHQLSSAAHEANNLLQVIAGSAEMIQINAALPDKVLQRAATIAGHAHRVSALLDSVRELAKFAPPRPGERTNLVTLVGSALDVRRHALTRNRIAVTTAHDDPAPEAQISWRPAMQLLLNLLLNAEYAVRGRAAAAIDLQIRRDGASVLLIVSDNGAGWPDVEPAPFTLRERDDAPPRLGIGLIAARLMAERAGGSIEVAPGPTGTIATWRLRGA